MAGNYKGFVFTLDAIFALVVAAAAITVLLYVHFTPQISLQEPSSEATSVLQTLLGTTVAQASVGSAYANYFTLSGNYSRGVWPFFGHDAQLSGYTPGYGPQVPRINLMLRLISPNIFAQPAVADGLVAVSTNAGPSALYLINATTGKLVVNTTIGNVFTSFPAIYQHEVAAVNSLVYTSIYTESGGLIYSGAAGVSTTNTIVTGINNFFQQSGGLVIAANGTSASVALAGANRYVAYQAGEYIISWQPTSTTFGAANAFSLNRGTFTQTWAVNTFTKANTTIPSISGNYFALGAGGNLSVYTLGGKRVIVRSFPTQIVSGPAFANGTVYAATTNTIYALSVGSNTIIFSTNILTPDMPSSQVIRPRDLAVTPTTAYLLANGSILEAFSTSTGNRLWYTALNGTGFIRLGGLAVAYGNVYAVVGKSVYEVSGCTTNPQSSLLQAIATFYLNGEGGCAALLLNSTYSAGNVGIYINGVYGPALSVANFSDVIGNAFINPAPNLPTSNTVSVSAWIYPSNVQDTNGAGIISYGTKYCSIATSSAYAIELQSTLRPKFTAYCDDYAPTTGPAAIPNRWNFIAATVSGNFVTLYINNASESKSITNAITPTSNALSIGGLLPATENFNGLIANVQLYGNTLTANQIQLLYQEGIGGLPIPNNGLAGWWPLQGDGGDYSGNGNSGSPFGNPTPNFVASSYTPPSVASAFEVSSATVPMVLNVSGTYKSYNVSVAVWRR